MGVVKGGIDRKCKDCVWVEEGWKEMYIKEREVNIAIRVKVGEYSNKRIKEGFSKKISKYKKGRGMGYL